MTDIPESKYNKLWVVSAYINKKETVTQALSNSSQSNDGKSLASPISTNSISTPTENVKKNQQENISDTDNLNPTDNEDIRYSMGNGYDGYSMSNNARDAYENGRKAFYLHEALIKTANNSPFMAAQSKTETAGKLSATNSISTPTENVKNTQQENISGTDNPNPSEDVEFSMGAPYIDRYTEKQYNNFRWVSANNVVTPYERETLLSRYADFKHNKDRYPVTKNGEAVIYSTETPDIMMYVKGAIRNPKITKIVRINADNETISIVKEKILYYEGQKVLFPYQVVTDYFGEEILSINRRKDYESFSEYKSRLKRERSEESDTDSRTSENRNGSDKQNTENDRTDLNKSVFSFGTPEQFLRYNPKRYAEVLIRKYRSRADVDTVTDLLEKAVTEYNKFNTESANEYLNRAAQEISDYVKLDRTQWAQELLDGIKGRHITLSAEIWNSFLFLNSFYY